jgi:small-conductance mechanosensitive channel
MMDMSALRDMVLPSLVPLDNELTSPWILVQIGSIAVAAIAALAVAAALRSRRDRPSSRTWPSPVRRLGRGLSGSAGIVVFALITMAMRAVMVALAPHGHGHLLVICSRLAIAWLIIRLAASVIRNDLVVRLVSLSAWAIAALSILGWLDPVVDALDSAAIVVGGIRLTPLLVIKACVLLAIGLWLAGLVSRFIESRIEAANDLTPSLQVLLSKIVHLALMVVAVMLVLAAVGINVSSLAVFTGAIGVGLGLGLQKIVSNFVSGIILLTDKSVKPGDLITVGDSSGVVNAMRTRYISVAAGDGREILIPNEDLVTQKVVNWTYTNRNALVKVVFGTTYDGDPRAVSQHAVDVAAATPRVMADKPPACLLTEFGDNGMRFALSFWVADLNVGLDAIKSEVMMALWEAFRREGIAMAIPVRDIRLLDTRLPEGSPADAADHR